MVIAALFIMAKEWKQPECLAPILDDTDDRAASWQWGYEGAWQEVI